MTDDEKRLTQILEATRHVMNWTTGVDLVSFRRDVQLLSAVNYQIMVMGEETKNLSSAFRDRRDEIPWRKIAKMRDFLIHQHHHVDPTVVWTTARDNVPRLNRFIVRELTAGS